MSSILMIEVFMQKFPEVHPYFGNFGILMSHDINVSICNAIEILQIITLSFWLRNTSQHIAILEGLPDCGSELYQ